MARLHTAIVACLCLLLGIPLPATWAQGGSAGVPGRAGVPGANGNPAAPGVGAGREPAPDETTTYVNGPIGARVLEAVKALESQGFTGAVLAARDGRVVAAAGVGKATASADNTPATLFEIASLTKSFTGAGVLRLAQREPAPPLALSDPIARHLPGIPENCRAITVEQLLHHTSGIPGDNSSGSGDDLAAVLPQFLKGGPRHEPGTHFEYWNQGYALLSEVIARASGQRYTDFCRAELFTPMGMTSTCFTGDQAPPGALVAIGRSSRGPARSALEHPYGSYGFQYRGMGGIVSSVWDLYRYDRALRAAEQGAPGAVLSPASVKALFTPGPGDYGLGWFVRTDPAGQVVHEHSGGVRGFVCTMRRYPAQDAVLIVLCNRDDAPVGRIADTLEAVLLERRVAHPHDAKVKPLPEDLRAALLGTFIQGSRRLVITADGAATRGDLAWGGPGAPVTRGTIGLNAAGEPVYFDGSEMLGVTIERDGDGTAKALKIMDMAFTRTTEGAGKK
jgi:CubicO group peptidase (beta-lactamase class C family)